jgi:ABC-2 type transport system permease protein
LTVKRFFNIYAAYLRKGAAAFFQYPADQAISALSLIVQQTAAFAALWVIVSASGQIGGWGFHDILILYSFSLMISALDNALFDGIWNIGNVYVRRGLFDIILTRPVPLFLQLICHRFEFSAFALFGFALALSLWALHAAGAVFTGAALLLYPLFLVCGIAITSSIYLVFNSFNFWLVRGNEIADLAQTVQSFSKYPQHIFPRALQFIMAFVLPYSFTTYYPASILTGRMSIGLVIPLLAVTACSVLAGAAVWRLGLRSYNSTGS